MRNQFKSGTDYSQELPIRGVLSRKFLQGLSAGTHCGGEELGFAGRDAGPSEKQKLWADTEGESADELDTWTRKGEEGREGRLLSVHGLWLLVDAWIPLGLGLMGRQLRPFGGSWFLPGEGRINLPQNRWALGQY